nr:MAG TPA: hypothetical protein [Caudoviricetes sp.]
MKTTENTHPNRKISHTGKIWGKKFSEKNLSEATHPRRKVQERGYATDLQVVTSYNHPRYTPFVNKKKFFSTTTEFRNLYI